AVAEKRRAVEEHEKLMAAHRAEVHSLELERAHWKDRVQDVLRQLRSVDEDLASLDRSREARLKRAAQAERQGAEVESALPALRDRVAVARAHLEKAEAEATDE